ncbi:S phase cyclin A-associated protein in the endoplasmic reticulum [Nymphaea thermarum]|nr:S phase cyclin A-associated protein in the endoplasmic reticulum [Nymphaea thermarum]
MFSLVSKIVRDLQGLIKGGLNEMIVLVPSLFRFGAETGRGWVSAEPRGPSPGVGRSLDKIVGDVQQLSARPDLQMEFFHLMSFFLSHCTSKWKSATDQVGLLLLETLLLLGYFALFHPGNQAVLRWGKSPTILHKVCDLPFVFFSDPDLTPVLAGTLVAACYGCEQNRGVVQQELSMDMLLSVLKSCRQGSLNSRLDHASLENSSMDDTSNANRPALESRRLQADIPVKPSRSNQKYSRVVLGKGGFSGGNGRTSKAKPTGNQKDLRGGKGVEASPLFILHNRFPSSFLDKAEEFFSSALKANN